MCDPPLGWVQSERVADMARLRAREQTPSYFAEDQEVCVDALIQLSRIILLCVSVEAEQFEAFLLSRT